MFMFIIHQCFVCLCIATSNGSQAKKWKINFTHREADTENSRNNFISQDKIYGRIVVRRLFVFVWILHYLFANMRNTSTISAHLHVTCMSTFCFSITSVEWYVRIFGFCQTVYNEPKALGKAKTKAIEFFANLSKQRKNKPQ